MSQAIRSAPSALTGSGRGAEASSSGPRPIVSTRTVRCRADICSLWNAITDTERLNRAVGMDRVSLSPISDSSAARYLASTRLGGFSVQYEERPYEWVYLQQFKVLRKMRNGPVASLEMSFVLDRNELGGTDLRLTLTMVPRIALLQPIVRFRAAQNLKRFEREIEQLDATLAGAEPGTLPARALSRGNATVHESALGRAAKKLGGIDGGAAARRLVGYVRDAGDVDVSRMRPFSLAEEWELPRREVLAACLHAVNAGLLDLRWEVVCPSCRTATEALPSLASLTDHGRCQLCDIAFSLDLDEAVEATFAPTRAVREIDAGPYCIGGPARTPHVVAQVIVPARGAGVLPAPADAGHYRLFVRGGAAAQLEVEEGAAAELIVDGAALPSDQRLHLGLGGKITVTNAGDAEHHAKIERVAWAQQAATAREVTSMPGFRRDFSSDVLRPGTALRVSRVALFFSDLTGSTQLYSDVGDAAAFKLVQDHFDYVLALTEKHGGTLVKTIGDAVMAVYADEMDGLRACLEILSGFAAFRKRAAVTGHTDVKLGLFAGPCYVVTANGVLDYFGQSVNIAARLQSEARSGEVVLEAGFADDAVAAGVLPEGWVRERYQAALKGVAQAIGAVRIKPE
jgi:class 3 adenylate cyclase